MMEGQSQTGIILDGDRTDGSVGIKPTLLAIARLRALRADSERPSELNSSVAAGRPLAAISAKSSLGVGKVG